MNLLPLNSLLPAAAKTDSLRFRALASAGILLTALLWSSWTTLTAMADRWERDPQYSHGFLVPVFALVVLWHRGDLLKKATWQPCLLGLPVLLVGVALRLFAIRRELEPLDAFALLPTLFGVVLFVGGKSVLRWSWPALAFLTFMIPLPFFLDTALAHPLRGLATVISTYALQTLGYPAIAEGNIILIDQVKLGVVEACSGLGMLMTFIALATALALVSKAPLLDRALLIVSAAPIAVIANVVRITATGMVYHGFGSATVHAVLHDLSGWLMMPLALLLLWLELLYLNKVWMRRQDVAGPLAISGHLSPG
jgi:exosortase